MLPHHAQHRLKGDSRPPAEVIYGRAAIVDPSNILRKPPAVLRVEPLGVLMECQNRGSRFLRGRASGRGLQRPRRRERKRLASNRFYARERPQLGVNEVDERAAPSKELVRLDVWQSERALLEYVLRKESWSAQHDDVGAILRGGEASLLGL